MNKQINTQNPKQVRTPKSGNAVEHLPFDSLTVSDLNGRTLVDDNAITRLADNIRDKGLIQNLAGYRDKDGTVGIVAGGRRLRALALLQDDTRFQTVPVKVTTDAVIAKAWAASENHLRAGLHPADEVAEYGRMARDGVEVPAISLAFGVSEAHVYKRLALAGLPEPVLSALRTDEVSLSMAACFTLCNDNANAMAVLERVRENPVSEHVLRRMLKPTAVSSTDRRARFVDEKMYTGAGGRITRDLFSEETLFDDEDILQQVFEAELDRAASDLQMTGGWKWARASTESYVGLYQIEQMKAARIYPVPGDLGEEQAERYEVLCELAENDALDAEGASELSGLQATLDGAFTDVQKAASGVLIYVEHDGVLRQCAGLVAKEDRAAAEAAGILEPSRHPQGKADKSAISGKLQSDLDRITTGARQSAVLDQPDLLLDLLAFQLSGRMGYRTAFGLREEDVPNSPAVSTGFELCSKLTKPK